MTSKRIYARATRPPKTSTLIRGGHIKQDQILLEAIVNYTGVSVYRKSYLMWSPVKIVEMSYILQQPAIDFEGLHRLEMLRLFTSSNPCRGLGCSSAIISTYCERLGVE